MVVSEETAEQAAQSKEELVEKLGQLEIRTGPGSWQSRKGVAIGLYGPPGSGKTHAAGRICLSPHAGRTVVLDAEGGLDSVSDLIEAGKLEYAAVTKWIQVENVTERAKNNPGNFPYRTIIFDNMSEYQPLHMSSITSDAPTLPEYHKNTRGMLAFVRTWRDLARINGFNVIFTMWEDTEKDEGTGRLKRTAGFTPKLAGQFPGAVDIMAYVTYVDGRSDLRLLDMEPSTRTASKFRRTLSEAAQSVPLKIAYRVDQNVLGDIIATLRDGVPWPKDKYPAQKGGGESKS